MTRGKGRGAVAHPAKPPRISATVIVTNVAREVREVV